MLHAHVAGRGRPPRMMIVDEQVDSRVLLLICTHNVTGVVFRRILDNEQFPMGIGLLEDRRYRFANIAGGVVHWHDNRDQVIVHIYLVFSFCECKSNDLF